ncbi:O-antigen ligase family protein [Natronosalvus caseinilyticus]|uniref:O-antigen ligase family protein n=1 Tax=Natronosalvus caseinilyticus TaxID=2953747 RepID=UPI0028B02FA5|nr:O-antigen ligase family protein [Natronosalvus caseinilyticus]
MATIDQQPASPLVFDRSDGWLVTGATGLLFACYLGLVVVANATDSVHAWHLAAVAVVPGAVLGCRLAVASSREAVRRGLGLAIIFAAAAAVLVVVYQSRSPGFGLESTRPLSVVAVFVAIVSFFLLVTDARQYSVGEWVAIGCFAVLAAVSLAHTLAFVPSSSQSRWPVWALVVMGSSLVVIPRLVPERVFLWTISRLAAAVVLLGLVTYLVGDYSLWLFEVRQWSGSPSLPGIETDVTIMRSIFVNPNSLGVVTFAGFVAAMVEFHRAVATRRPLGGAVTAALAGICGLGLFLSNARASMLAAATAVVVYAGYVVFGRRAVPAVLVATALTIGGFLLGMYVDVIGISDSNRFALWAGSLAAIRDGPLLFGYGAPAGHVIEPYLEGGLSASPHNSYLSVFVRFGLVGGLAYLGLVVGSVVAGAIEYREVDVAMLAFAAGWAVHQLFESYTLFWWSPGAVIGSLVIGYLLFGD